jgi:hypothetical protein
MLFIFFSYSLENHPEGELLLMPDTVAYESNKNPEVALAV